MSAAIASGRESGILAHAMRTLIPWKAFVALGLAGGLLAGCASAPAPVENRSFSSNEAMSPSAPAARGRGAVTIPIGHANGTVTQTGYTVAPGDTLYSIAFAHGLDYRALAARNGIAPPYVIHPGQILKLGGESAPATAPASALAGEKVTTVTTQSPPPSTSAQPEAAPVFGPVMTQTVTAAGVAPAASSTAGAAAPAVSASTVAAAPARTPAAAATTAAPAQPQTTAPPSGPMPPGKSRTVAGIAWQWPAGGKVIGGFNAGSGGDGAGLDIAGNAGDPVRAAADGTVVYSGNGLIGYGELIIIKHNDTYLSAYGHNSKRLVNEGQHVKAGRKSR